MSRRTGRGCGWSPARRRSDDAGAGQVRELFLNGVGFTVSAEDRPLLPVADIADLAVAVVVPSKWRLEEICQPYFAVGDRLDHLVRRDRSVIVKGGGAVAASGVAS